MAVELEELVRQAVVALSRTHGLPYWCGRVQIHVTGVKMLNGRSSIFLLPHYGRLAFGPRVAAQGSKPAKKMQKETRYDKSGVAHTVEQRPDDPRMIWPL